MDNVHGELAFWTLSQLSHYQNDTFTTVYFSCRKGILGGNFVASHFLRMLNISYLKLEQGCMIQWPAAFCLTLSWMSAFLDPKSFMASLLSVGWKMFWSWLRTQPGLESEENEKARLIKRPGMLVFYLNYYPLVFYDEKIEVKCHKNSSHNRDIFRISPLSIYW